MEFVKKINDEEIIFKIECKSCGECTGCEYDSGSDHNSKKVHLSNDASKATGG